MSNNDNRRADDALLRALLGDGFDSPNADGLDGRDPFDSLLRIMDPAIYYLADKDFTGLKASGKDSWKGTMDTVNAIDVDDIDAAFVVVLKRQRAGQVCEGCGQIHEGQDKDGVMLIAGSVGGPTTVAAMIDVGARGTAQNSVPDTDTTTPVFVEGGDSKQ